MLLITRLEHKVNLYLPPAPLQAASVLIGATLVLWCLELAAPNFMTDDLTTTIFFLTLLPNGEAEFDLGFTTLTVRPWTNLDQHLEYTTHR